MTLINHKFDPGYTGLSTRCNHIVVDSEGYGVTCNARKSDHIDFKPGDRPQAISTLPDDERNARRRIVIEYDDPGVTVETTYVGIVSMVAMRMLPNDHIVVENAEPMYSPPF